MECGAIIAAFETFIRLRRHSTISRSNWGTAMTFRVDPSRVDLAREFKQKIYGRHSGDLQRILNLFRSEPQQEQYVLIREARHGPWALAQYDATSPEIPHRVGPVFASCEEAEWAVFKLRWKRHTGQSLPFD
jgi:hypothetical protein